MRVHVVIEPIPNDGPGSIGHCHRHAPVIVPDVYAQPIVHKYYSCGDFNYAPPPEVRRVCENCQFFELAPDFSTRWLRGKPRSVHVLGAEWVETEVKGEKVYELQFRPRRRRV